jgi:hypothetical protein
MPYCVSLQSKSLTNVQQPQELAPKKPRYSNKPSPRVCSPKDVCAMPPPDLPLEGGAGEGEGAANADNADNITKASARKEIGGEKYLIPVKVEFYDKYITGEVVSLFSFL